MVLLNTHSLPAETSQEVGASRSTSTPIPESPPRLRALHEWIKAAAGFNPIAGKSWRKLTGRARSARLHAAPPVLGPADGEESLAREPRALRAMDAGFGSAFTARAEACGGKPDRRKNLWEPLEFGLGCAYFLSEVHGGPE